MDRVNQNLPAEFKISAPGATRARQLGFSEEVVMHMLFDRLEAQLSTLDVTTNSCGQDRAMTPLASTR
jgi:hypothetical protein